MVKKIHAYYTPVVEEEFVKNGKKKKRNNMDLDGLRKLILKHKPVGADGRIYHY